MKYEELRKKILSNPDAQKEYDRLQPEFQIIEAIMEARYERELTQQQLSDITGIDRSDISKLENGCGNPTIETLQRLAEGLGKKLVIRFE